MMETVVPTVTLTRIPVLARRALIHTPAVLSDLLIDIPCGRHDVDEVGCAAARTLSPVFALIDEVLRAVGLTLTTARVWPYVVATLRAQPVRARRPLRVPQAEGVIPVAQVIGRDVPGQPFAARAAMAVILTEAQYVWGDLTTRLGRPVRPPDLLLHAVDIVPHALPVGAVLRKRTIRRKTP